MKQTCSDWVKVKCNAIDAAQKQAGDPKNEEIIRRKLEELRNSAYSSGRRYQSRRKNNDE